MISYPADAQPRIQWNHVDGPLLTCRDGTPHWLTFRERFAVWLGLSTIYDIERRLLAGSAKGEANG